MTDSRKSSEGKIGSLMWDISGAFGDIGILLPIAVVLIVQNRFNPTALFLMAGLFYLGSAYYFKITMPVQPLKAMSTIAIAAGLSVEVINAAGISMGVILLLIAGTGLSVRLGSVIPVSVVRGLQFGLGLVLIKMASALIKIDLSVALIAAGILVATQFVTKRIPPLIPLLILAIPLSLKEIKLAPMGPLLLSPTVPDLSNFWMGFTLLVLPQLGLTFGNAIIATEATGKLLYGQRAEKLNLKSIPISMGIANLMSGILGGVPMCHGSGGLTAHRTFGATGERSGYIIGFTLISLALLFGNSVMSIVSVFPKGILGVLLCYVGIQHSLFVRDILREKLALFTALTVALTAFITNNLTLGFLASIGIHYALAGLRKTSISIRERVSFRRREPCAISRGSLLQMPLD